jgi:hypothetical protein
MCVGQRPRLWAVQRVKTYFDLFSNFCPTIFGGIMGKRQNVRLFEKWNAF